MLHLFVPYMHAKNSRKHVTHFRQGLRHQIRRGSLSRSVSRVFSWL